jgi:hypothetical protein
MTASMQRLNHGAARAAQAADGIKAAMDIRGMALHMRSHILSNLSTIGDPLNDLLHLLSAHNSAVMQLKIVLHQRLDPSGHRYDPLFRLLFVRGIPAFRSGRPSAAKVYALV